MKTVLIITMLTAGAAQDQRHGGVTRRGEAVMGFDQRITTHHFVLKPAGGDIEVTANDPNDAASIAQIRAHLRHITQMFTRGDFTAPMLIHAKEPPGVAAMKQGDDRVTYLFEEIERGGVVRIAAASPALRNAVHDFLRFQIKDHKTGDPVRY
jgi:hypothetical protein